MATYASDLTQSLSAALVLVAPTLVPASPAASDNALQPTDRAHATQDSSSELSEAGAAREAQLRRALALLQPPNSAPTASSAGRTSRTRSQGPPGAASDTARTGKHRLHSPRALADLARSLFPSDAKDETASPLTSVEYVVLAQLAVAAYGTILRSLMQHAAELEHADEYWSRIESDPASTAVYLVQSTPARVLALAHVTLRRFQALAQTARLSGAERPPVWSRETWRRAVPPSLFLTAVFPHLSPAAGLPSLRELGSADDLSSNELSTTQVGGPFSAAAAPSPANLARLGRRTARSLFFLTLSPLSLTRAEVTHKRRQIRDERDRLATQIGELTLAADAGGGSAPVAEDSEGGATVEKEDLRRRPGLAQVFGLAAASSEEEGDGAPATELSLDDVREATWQTLVHLEDVLLSSSDELAQAEGSGPQPRTAPDLARKLVDLLTSTFDAHESAFRTTSAALAPPSALTRAWPYLLSVPLFGGLVARTVYNHRASLRLWAQETVSTVRGFLLDWVVEPVRHILETLRGGDEGGIALMGRESLKSDLASLERMVVDFARDEYRLGPEELQRLAEQVKAGDLTPVLRVWEEDIKSPIRSAVRGSLVRTLLIQVQKVKVDVALAMDGIEKMLKSQQLTFAFVGVAPSMLILALVGRWANGLMRSDGSRRKRGEEKRRCWMVIRNLDLLLSPTRSSRAATKSTRAPSTEHTTHAAAALTQGHLLLSLSSLRSYAHSSHFPSRETQLRHAFLEDVRAIEDGATQAGEGERRALVRRLERWSEALGWNEGVRT